VYEAILRISFAAAPKNGTRLFSLYIGDQSTFFMRKDARDMTRKKICMPSTPCSALRRRKLSKSHPIDIRRACKRKLRRACRTLRDRWAYAKLSF